LKKGSFDGWVVMRHVDGVPSAKTPVLLTT
jgi:hypothetical protein